MLPALSAPLCVNTAIRFRCLRIRYGHSEVRKAEGEELTNLRKGSYLPFGWIPVLLALSCVLGGWGFVCWPTEPTWVALAAPDGVGFLKQNSRAVVPVPDVARGLLWRIEIVA